MRVSLTYKISIPITNEMKKKIDERMNECGHVTITEYIRCLLKRDLGYKQ